MGAEAGGWGHAGELGLRAVSAVPGSPGGGRAERAEVLEGGGRGGACGTGAGFALAPPLLRSPSPAGPSLSPRLSSVSCPTQWGRLNGEIVPVL